MTAPTTIAQPHTVRVQACIAEQSDPPRDRQDQPNHPEPALEKPLAIRWMDSADEFLNFERNLSFAEQDARRIAALDELDGHCAVCGGRTVFVVRTGARFEDRPNLREGLRCNGCSMTARQRTLLLAVRDTLGAFPQARGALLERYSRLYRRIRREYPRVIGSEFLSPAHESGRRYLWHPPGCWWRTGMVRHESVAAFSYPDGELDFVVHTDVLEHVADTGGALSECRRVLRRGCPVIFTVPFFSSQATTLVRGYLDDEGNLVELLPGEYHGDGLNTRGIYTYYNFGWDFFERLQGVFTRAQVGVIHDAQQGLVYADAQPGPFNMLPLVFRAYR